MDLIFFPTTCYSTWWGLVLQMALIDSEYMWSCVRPLYAVHPFIIKMLLANHSIAQVQLPSFLPTWFCATISTFQDSNGLNRMRFQYREEIKINAAKRLLNIPKTNYKKCFPCFQKNHWEQVSFQKNPTLIETAVSSV